MATQKQQKAELVAIYRLEFYKKQKNWKLALEARQEKELRSSHCKALIKNSKVLNETYSIDNNVDDDASVLNDAFLKDESDKDAPVSPPVQPSLHTQWLEPVNACQECQPTEMKPQNPWADYIDEGWVGLDVMDKCSGDGNEFEGFDGWVEGMVWTNSGIPQPTWTGDAPVSINIQGAEPPEQTGWFANNLLHHQLHQLDQLTPWPDDQMWVPDIWEEDDLLLESLESVDQFMIGAHSAPHSSEVELCGPSEGDGLDMSQGSVSRMSEAALSAAVRRHTGSLRRLLREARQRRKYRSTVSLDVRGSDQVSLVPRDFFSTDYSYEPFPTRDIPSTPLSPIYLCQDAITPCYTTKRCVDDVIIQPPLHNNFTPMFSRNKYDGGPPLPLTNQYKNDFAQLPTANICKDDFVQLPSTNICKDDFVQMPSKSICKDDFVQIPSKNICKGGSTLQPSNQYREASTPVCPANLYRVGFLAGSHRNKVPLKFIGRGRGRLQD